MVQNLLVKHHFAYRHLVDTQYWKTFVCHGTKHNDTQHNDISVKGFLLHSEQMTLSITTPCIKCWLSICWVSHFIHCYAECHYAEFCEAVFLKWCLTKRHGSTGTFINVNGWIPGCVNSETRDISKYKVKVGVCINMK